MFHKFNEKSDVNFMLQNSFIHYEKNSDSKLCILMIFKKKIFKMIHDDNAYKSWNRTLKKIRHVFYIKHLSKCLIIYIKYYLECFIN